MNLRSDLFFQVNSILTFTSAEASGFHDRSLLHSAAMSGSKDAFDTTLAALGDMVEGKSSAEVKPSALPSPPKLAYF